MLPYEVPTCSRTCMKLFQVIYIIPFIYYIIPFYVVYISMEQFCLPFMYIISFIYIILYNTILYSIHVYGIICPPLYIIPFIYIILYITLIYSIQVYGIICPPLYVIPFYIHYTIQYPFIQYTHIFPFNPFG